VPVAKTINLLLEDGTLNGVISIEDSSWNAGELYSAPRASITELLNSDACKTYGVYLLLSSKTVYVGQSSDLSKRIIQHTIGKDWWESAVILTTKDDSLNHSDIDYLEHVLIEKALSSDWLDCDNKNRGNPPKVDKFRKVWLDQYLGEALFLMQLIGINVFAKKNSSGTLIDAPKLRTVLSLGRRVKSEAIQFVKDNGVQLGKFVSYGNLQKNKPEFWINPVASLVSKDWFIVLNNNEASELVVLRIPGDSLHVGEDNGLVLRSDKPQYIDLNINKDTLVDRKSNVDFSGFVIKKIEY